MEEKTNNAGIDLSSIVQQKKHEEPSTIVPIRLDNYSESLLKEIKRRRERGKKYRFVGLDFGFNKFNEAGKYEVSKLNFILNGLNPELYVIAGGSAIGKTTLLRQMMDEITLWNNWIERRENNDGSTYPVYIDEMPLLKEKPNNKVICIYFSYEQGINELQFKSISRIAGINSGELYRGTLSDANLELIENKLSLINKYGEYQFIVEADYNTTVDKILDITKRLKEKTKAENAVIFIDYLQIIPIKGEGDNRSMVEANISELRRIARKEKFPVIALSSVARGKDTVIGLETGKESGLIEFTADVYMNLINDGIDKYKNKRIILLAVSKNRNGEQKFIKWEFTPQYSIFEESEASDYNPDYKPSNKGKL